MKTILLVCCLAAVAMGEFPRQWRQYFVDWHNEFRRNQGASNMCRMQWSESLAQQADEWVSKCEFNGYYNNGMNFAYYTGENNMENMRKVFQEWAGEREEYDFSGSGCGNSCRYSQMVWYNTREIGCSVRRCPSLTVYDTVYENAWYMACSYSPRGNMYNDFYNNGEMNMNNMNSMNSMNMNGYQSFYPFMRGQACQYCNECEDGLCVGEYNSEWNNWFNGNGNGNWNFNNNGFSNWNNWNQNNEWNNNENSNWNFNNWNSDYDYSNWNSNGEWNNNMNFNNGFSNWNNWYGNDWNNNQWNNNGYNNWYNNGFNNNNGMSNWNNNGFSNWNNWYNQNNDYGYWNFNSNWNNFANYRCQDMRPYCMMWSSQGQCESNNYYMMKYCPQSCNYCGWYQNYFQNYNNFDNWNEYFNNRNGWTEYYNSNYYNNEFNNEECTNESSECEQFGSQVCFNKPYWARRNCRQMCNFC